jgi:NADPH:quinone reductase-like Zn-dependent oxidoreductase
MMIREGAFADVWPATFPEGQGNDFSGRVVEVGPGAGGFSPGDEVMGFTPRAAQADYVRSASDRLARKPPGVPWEVAAAIAGAGSTAYAAVRAVRLRPGETVVVSAAAGGVGVVAAQLARRAGARVIGTAGDANAAFLRSLGVEPVRHGDGLLGGIQSLAPDGVDASWTTSAPAMSNSPSNSVSPPIASTRSSTAPPPPATAPTATPRSRPTRPRSGRSLPSWSPRAS